MALNLQRLFFTRSIKNQLAWTFSGVGLVIMMGLALLVYAQQRTFLYDTAEQHGKAVAKALASSSISWILANDLAGLDEVMQGFIATPDLERAYILTLEGKVLSSTQSNEAGLFVSDSQNRNLLLKSLPTTQVLLDNSQQLDIAEPVFVDNRHIGWVRVQMHMDSVNDSLKSLLFTSLKVILFGAFAMLVISIALAKKLTHSLYEIIATVNCVTHGQHEARIKVLRCDELGTLGTGINQMLEVLSTTEAELRTYHLQLERLVFKRTEQLMKAVEAAEAANIAKSTFIATMSHELRTPMNAILGFSELMSQDENASASQKDTLAIINRSGEHLLSMINDVLDISKIEAGRFELDLQPFDLLKLLQDIDDMISFRAASKKLSFRLEVSSNTPQYIKSDGGKLRQVLINLLGNAIKFTQQGGIILRTYTQPLCTDPAKLLLSIEISDSGVGIPTNQLNDLFKPFVQLAQKNADVNGTGLGLAISKALVELMDGTISVSSTLGVGSTFKLELPVHICHADDIVSEKESRLVKGLAPQQPEWRLLIADDNLENRLLLASILKKIGFQVREAENGQEAVTVFEQWRPHLIWMDMRMPVMDGYQATTAIRQLEGGKEVKILALTASVFKEQHDSIFNAGCDAIIYKPFHTSEIFAALAKYLQVEFIYQAQPAAIASSTIEMTVEMLAKLPIELRQQLHEAALTLNTEDTDSIIAQINTIAPDIATGLQNLADHYQFDQIIQLTEITTP